MTEQLALDLPATGSLAVPGFDPAALCALLAVPFSDEQIAAITRPLEPFVVVAGAGSGKTSVMTARVVWLVATGALRPDQVLGLTFTTKAAGELAARVRAALRRLSDQHGLATAVVDELGEPVVATYHAFAARLLAEHGLRLGIEPGSRLLGEAGAYQLAERVVAAGAADLSSFGLTFGAVVERLLHLDGELAEHLVEPARLADFDAALVAQLEAVDRPVADVAKVAATASRRRLLAELVTDLRTAKHRRDLVGFADQMRFSAELAGAHPDVGAALREQYAVVLLDEYQDTSVSQRILLTSLFGGGHPVTAVGDPLQAIYGWRGASVENIDRFAAHFARHDGSPAPVLALAQNRRSGARILDAANAVAEPLRALHPQVRSLLPGTPGGGGLRVALLERQADEIAWVADRVAEQVRAGVPAGDVAVLCRGARDFPSLLTAFGERDLPVQVKGLDGMLATPEVAEVIAVLGLLHDSTANPSLVRLLAGARWRIGPRDLAILGRRSRDLAHRGPRPPEGLEHELDDAVGGVDPAELSCLLDAVEDPGPEADFRYDPVARARFAAFAAELRGLRRHVGQPLAELIHQVVTTIGLDVELAASPQLRRRRRAEGLAAFADLAAAFNDTEGEASLGAFLRWLRVGQAYDAVPDLDLPGSADAVQLMTIHRAKGLEWPVVVLPFLTAGVFPPVKGRDRWTSQAQVLPYPLRGDADSLPRLSLPIDKAALVDFTEQCRVHDEREERRLAYVAVTRAKRLVLASGSWWGPTQRTARGPSPYLQVLQEQCVAGGGSIDVWTAPPPDPKANPYLGQATPVAWPAAEDAAAAGWREAAAAAVLARRGTTLAELGPPAGLDPAAADLVAGWDTDLRLLLDELAAGRAPTRTVALPTSLSASELVRLAADEPAFLQALVRPMPLAPVPAARRGTRFHAWVEQHYGVRPLLGPDELPGAADADIDSDAELLALQQAFLRTPYAERAPVGIEVAFSLVLAGRVVPGRIDAVFATGAGQDRRYEVVDWKTSAAGSADPVQLAVYRVAYAELAGVPVDRVDAAFVHVRDGTVVRPDDLPDKPALELLLS